MMNMWWEFLFSLTILHYFGSSLVCLVDYFSCFALLHPSQSKQYQNINCSSQVSSFLLLFNENNRTGHQHPFVFFNALVIYSVFHVFSYLIRYIFYIDLKYVSVSSMVGIYALHTGLKGSHA